jgi:antitoxin component YwqK of YwqJK toxin-antitoxin module
MLSDLNTENSLVRYKKKKFKGIAYTNYEDGKLESSREYKKGMLNGVYNYYHENGQLKLSILFENNQRVGKSLSYFENGQLYIEESYENGLPEGESVMYDEFGKIKLKMNLHKGVPEGLYSEYFDDDYPYYGMMVNGKREGEWICFDKDSNILLHQLYFNDIEIPLKQESYYENGQLESTSFHLGGKAVGEWKYFFSNGQIALIQNWVEDLRDGESILYEESGNILGKMIYSKGEIIHDSYYENGQLNSTKFYLGGKAVGEWKYFFSNGQIELIQNWVEDLRDGVSMLYDESGNILGKKIYSKGEMISCEGKCD